MNLGHEQIPELGHTIEVQLSETIREERDAFILEFINPYCEQELGRRIEKQELIRALLNNTPKPVQKFKGVTSFADCPTCFNTLVRDVHPSACGYCGQRVTWEEADK